MIAFTSSKGQLLSLLLVLLAALPSMQYVPSLLPPLLLLPIILHKQTKKLIWLQMLMTLLVITGAAGLLYLSGRPWLSSQTILTGLITILILKWAEANSPREFKILIPGAAVMAALSSLYLTGLSALVFLILIIVLLLVTLLAMNDEEDRLAWLALFKRGINMGLVALPLMIVLFFTMPRVQGSLWDLGLVMGLPMELMVNQQSKGAGVKTTLKAGQVSRLKRSDALVLVAEFEVGVPYKSQMYWRGPVFSNYQIDGWKLPPNWNNRAEITKKSYRGKDAVEQVLTSKSDRMHYEARVSPNGTRWLYGLDLASGTSPEVLISEYFQLVSIRTFTQEFKYDVDAWLEYSGGRQLTEQQKTEYLAWPAGTNPRLKAFGEKLMAEYPLTLDRLQELYLHLAGGGYKVSLKSDIEEGKNSLDQYFFDKKQGTIEHLASSTAMVLRAAGIPTRLVTGYRGGSLIALTNYVVVKQEHAHVWVEAWTDDNGWQRVEAKDLVAPPTREERLQPVAAKPKPKPKPEAKKKEKKAEPKPEEAANKPQKPTASEVTNAEPENSTPVKKEKSWFNFKSLNWLTELSSGMENWIVNYSPERQVELMKKSGLRKVNWKSLLAVALSAMLLLIVVYLLLLQVKRVKADPINLAFEKLNKAFTKLGLECKENECPTDWLSRVQQTNPELYLPLQQIVEQYIEVRYCTTIPDTQKIKTLVQDVKRLVAML